MSPQLKLALEFIRKHKPKGPQELADIMGLKTRQHAQRLIKTLADEGLIIKSEPYWKAK